MSSDSSAGIGDRGLVGRGGLEEISSRYGRRLRRAVLGGLGAVVLAVLAGACGSGGTLAEPGTPQETVGKDRTVDTRVEEIIHLDYWHGYVLNMTWSPDGSRILITGNTDSDRYENWNSVEDWNIFVVDVDGSNLVQITDWPGNEWGTWSPDGARILIKSNSDPEDGDLYVVDVDGSNLVQLTDWPGNERGVWSPDGSRVLVTYPAEPTYSFGDISNTYTTRTESSTMNISDVPVYDDYDLYVVNVDGSNLVQLTDWPGNEWGVWSPDGSRILLTGNDEIDSYREYNIYVVEADGSNLVQLTDWPGGEHDAEWSTEGSRVLFSHDGDFFVVEADGSGLIQLADQSYSVWGVWSPDDSRILLTSNSDAREDDLYVVNADGSNLVQLTDWPGAERGVWSPDSSRVLVTGVHHLGDVYVVDVDGSNLVPLTDWPGDWRGPEHMLGWWSPDGSRVLVIGDSDDDNWNLYVVDVHSSNMVQLTDQPGREVGWWSSDGSHILISGVSDNSVGLNDVYVIRVSS